MKGALLEFGKSVESALCVGKGADKDGRNSPASYRRAPGEISGCINLAIWHMIGGEVSGYLSL